MWRRCCRIRETRHGWRPTYFRLIHRDGGARCVSAGGDPPQSRLAGQVKLDLYSGEKEPPLCFERTAVLVEVDLAGMLGLTDYQRPVFADFAMTVELSDRRAFGQDATGFIVVGMDGRRAERAGFCLSVKNRSRDPVGLFRA